MGLGIKSMAGLKAFMVECYGHNAFAHPIKFDELLQQSHFSSFLGLSSGISPHITSRWPHLRCDVGPEEGKYK